MFSIVMKISRMFKLQSSSLKTLNRNAVVSRSDLCVPDVYWRKNRRTPCYCVTIWRRWRTSSWLCAVKMATRATKTMEKATPTGLRCAIVNVSQQPSLTAKIRLPASIRALTIQHSPRTLTDLTLCPVTTTKTPATTTTNPLSPPSWVHFYISSSSLFLYHYYCYYH